ncbi:MAG: phosphoribosylaminoimidazolesuccinocarboxamide synthase [Candidatus Eremiobacteraeota bacterium]|nr:phosphoribosylaminoimidazolesuccinocarboxamide synthase [Candidatus Eremiobacteraeota bacterium]
MLDAARTIDFERLPFVTEGESKVIRRYAPGILAIKLKPTVYSFTHNRYGEVPGTDVVRAYFAAETFGGMERAARDGTLDIRTAFLGLEETEDGPLLLQRDVEPCNLEVRVKRYHVGSPLHRYRYTERHRSTLGSGPVRAWTRFSEPVVCFDWRHPLCDDSGSMLADEPISDDYAALWMLDPARAKKVARSAFAWLEALFAEHDVTLVDICFFIDRTGTTLYGEISPDCMRVRHGSGDPERSEPGDKDSWRRGDAPDLVYERYRNLYQQIFPNAPPIAGKETTP